MAIWQKAQQAGYVDANYQPLISRTQAALLADEMAKRLAIKHSVSYITLSLSDSLWEPQTRRLAVGKHTARQP